MSRLSIIAIASLCSAWAPSLHAAPPDLTKATSQSALEAVIAATADASLAESGGCCGTAGSAR